MTNAFRLVPLVQALLAATGSVEPTPSPAAGVPGASAEITVALVQMEVRVEDRKGNFVPGLGIEDFELLEDGQPRPIHYVDDLNAAAATSRRRDALVSPTSPAATPASPAPKADTRSVVLLLDGANSSREALSRQRQFLDGFVRTLDGNTLVGVFELRPDGSFELRRRFSRDPTEVRRAIAEAKLGAGGMDERTANLRQLEDTLEDGIRTCTRQTEETCQETAFQRLVQAAKRLAGEARLRAEVSIESARSILAFSDHLPGTRSLIFVSQGIDPGGTVYFNGAAKLLQYYSQQGGNRLANSYINEVQQEASMYESELARFEALTEAALKSGITVYWINPAHDTSPSAFSPERGFESYMVGGDLVPVLEPAKLMQALAQDTGGLTLSRAFKTEEFYERIGRDIGRYYLVSYVPARTFHDGKTHETALRTKRKDLRVRSRSSYTDAVPAERTVRHLASALDFPEMFDEMPVATSLSWLRTAKDRYAVYFRVAVPYAEIRPDVRGGNARDVLHFGIVVRDERGAVLRNEHPFVSVAEPLETFDQRVAEKASIEYGHTLDLKPGRYYLDTAVLDEAGNRTAARRFPLLLPPVGASCLTATPLLIARSARQTDDRVETLSFTHNGEARVGNLALAFAPTVVLPPKGELRGLYQLLDPRRGTDLNASVQIFFRLYRDQTFINQTPPTTLTRVTDGTAEAITSYFSVPYSNLGRGSYRLELVAHDATSGCDTLATADFRIETLPAPRSGTAPVQP